MEGEVVYTLPHSGGECGACYEKPEDAHIHGLNCAGFGSAASVTSVFGMLAAARVLNALAAKAVAK